MPLSRLDNFLKNVRGNIIYVNPNDLDATDDIENQGNSMGRPFKTIQRALIEASRFSYQRGLDNDRFDKTTIMLSPGEHLVDNRPGWIPLSSNDFQLRNGVISSDFAPFSSLTNFDINATDNDLYKLNSVHGGVIIPRGTSIIGQDLRKTKIRPLYVPNPENSNIETSAIFRVTGGSYFFQFTLFDGNPNGTVYKDYSTGKFVPNFSHHKLTAFEYADGTNDVEIDDAFIVNGVYSRTDLDMYYEKVGLAYGSASGRAIEPDYPSSGLDIQAKIDEYRIVGPSGGSIGISSIRAGDGVTASTLVTVELEGSGIAGLDVDTAFQVNSVDDSGYNGSFVVDTVLATDSSTGNTTQFQYEVPVAPTSALENPASATVSLDTDTVTSASPYIFNISLRSVYGMSGVHADGSKASGFKSMVVAQFTGVSLQKDDNAFIKYDRGSGTFLDSTTVSNIHSDPDAKYKPDYYNYHIKASNNAIMQLVSIFAIGYAQQFVTESGGDFSVTNSNSNFGETALVSKGFRNEAFSQDDVGYITHIIPPQEIIEENFNLEYDAIDVTNTIGIASDTRLYLYNKTNASDAPRGTIQGFRLGAAVGDKLYVGISSGAGTVEYSARIVMPNTENSTDTSTSVKSKTVGRTVAGINSITSNTITFVDDHQFINGETIRFISDNARLPDGIESNKVYFAITEGLNADQIRVASSINEANDQNEIDINNLGGGLRVESRVSDKNPGDVGHPIQFDSDNGRWYVTVGAASTDNNIYSTFTGLGTAIIGEATSRSYFTRKSDTRSVSDKIYKFRYVIPAAVGITSARPPRTSFVLEESNDVSGATNTEVALKYNPNVVTMTNQSQVRNFSFIKDATFSSDTITVTTEESHGVNVGSKIKLNNITSTTNTVGAAKSGYNGTYSVASVPSSTEFVLTANISNPGTFTNNTSQRTTSLPTFQRVSTPNTYFVYDIDTIREYESGVQDGVYYLTVIDASSTPAIAPYNDSSKFAFSQPIKDLYPQYDRDNPISDPDGAISYAKAETLGEVVVDSVKNSITRTTASRGQVDLAVGAAITDIQSNEAGTHHTIFTNVDHGFNRIVNLNITDAGAGYGNGTGGVEYIYNATLSPTGTGVTGINANARVTVNASGNVTDVIMMNPGTNYKVGDNLNITGTATTTGFSQASVAVTSIYSNIGDSVRITGITSFKYSQYNQLYEITGISSTNSFEAKSITPVGNGSTTGIGADVTTGAFEVLTGPSIAINTLEYDNVTGLATVTSTGKHGFRTNNSITIAGATNDLYNGSFVVTRVVGLSTFIADIGASDSVPSVSGTIKAYSPGLVAQPGTVTLYDENFGGRNLDIYDNLCGELSSAVPNVSTDEISIDNLSTLDLKLGDYLRIDDEMMRIKTTVTTNPVRVFRGLFGTSASTHVSGSVIRRVQVGPIELRRPSITRASGHTFEYIGYGPGNYSTSLPQKQAGQLTIAQQIASQSSQSSGGVNVFTGMNDRGDFFIGNKRISSATGKEEVYDTPIPTITGEDIFSLGSDIGIDVITPLEATVSRSLRVEGGQGGNLLTQFDGPVLLSKKVTSTSPEGIEASSIFLQGNANVSRKITVGISTPTLAGTSGDIVFNTSPTAGADLGWVYTVENGWYSFGSISLEKDGSVQVFDTVGIGTTSPDGNILKVGAGPNEVAINNNGLGIGITAGPSYKLNVQGDARVAGDITAATFTGDGSGLVNLANDSLWGQVAGVGKTGLYPLNDLNIGIGYTQPTGDYSLDLGLATDATGSLNVRNNSNFAGIASFATIQVNTDLICDSDYDLDSTAGTIVVGVMTATNIKVGSGSTIITTTVKGVGINTLAPSAALDVAVPARIQSSFEFPQTVSSVSQVVTLSIDEAQTFELTTTQDIAQFVLQNIVPNSTVSFTLKITQGATPRTVDIDDFRTSGGAVIPVYWPGGVIPTVTNSANVTDIYSFITFDGGSSLYGVVGGQNFS